jgi:hypothetical protein
MLRFFAIMVVLALALALPQIQIDPEHIKQHVKINPEHLDLSKLKMHFTEKQHALIHHHIQAHISTNKLINPEVNLDDIEKKVDAELAKKAVEFSTEHKQNLAEALKGVVTAKEIKHSIAAAVQKMFKDNPTLAEMATNPHAAAGLGDLRAGVVNDHREL